MKDTYYQKLQTAQKSVESAARKLIDDPMRPSYHFLPPAQWINDPNGTFFCDGYYHVFYQINPFGDAWDHIHWGYIKTKDFLHWEQFSIAVAPDATFHNEVHCFSGGAMITKDKEILLMYTSVPHDRDNAPNCQVILRNTASVKNIFQWERYNKVLAIDAIPFAVNNDWRDPFIFKKDKSYFMIVGANISDDNIPAVLCFESTDDSLLTWTYKSIVKKFEKNNFQFFECPNILQLKNTLQETYDVLLGSPFEPVRYYVGNFNTQTGTFKTEKEGFVDHCITYYATNAFFGELNRCCIISWIREFPKGLGWNGCHSLPRELSLDSDNILLQKPIQEIYQLHNDEIKIKMINNKCTIPEAICKTIHLQARIPKNEEISISTHANEKLVEIKNQHIIVNGNSTPILITDTQQTHIYLEVFLDNSVIECFCNEGRTCVSAVTETLHAAKYIAIQVSSDAVDITVHSMKAITFENI